MFNTKSAQRPHIRRTQREVNVTESELALFRELNKDESKIREAANAIKMTNAELAEFPSDVALILQAKTEKLLTIKRNVGTLVSIGNTVGLLTVGNGPLIETLNLVRESNTDLSRFLLGYLGPSLVLEENGDFAEDKVVVMSSANSQSVSTILKKFRVPEGIAADIEDIYTRGPDASNVTSIIGHFSFNVSKKAKSQVDGSDFDP